MVLDCVSTCLVVCHGVHLFDCEFVCHCVHQYTVMSWYVQSCHGVCISLVCYRDQVCTVMSWRVPSCHSMYHHVTVSCDSHTVMSWS